MRRRLIVVSIAVTSMVALAFLVPLMLLTRTLASDRALASAEQDAETAARLLSASPGQDREAALTTLGFSDLTLVLADGSAIGPPVPVDEDLSAPRRGAAGNQSVKGGVAVYVPVADSNGDILVIRNFVPDEELTQGVGRSWITLTALAVLLVGVAVLAADRLARSVVEPAEKLSWAASELGHGRLETRLEPAGPPELAAVASEFNHLAGRISQLLREEREVAADLSHRLRTPLTAARLNTESLPEGHRRDQLLQDLDRLERTIDHIIQEARKPSREPESVDLIGLVTDRTVFWQALADEQDRASDLVIDVDAAHVDGDPSELSAALDALIGNVFAHTPEGIAYRVTLGGHGDRFQVIVDDAGPGIGSAEALRRGVSHGGSTGLGLDIARRATEGAGGSMATTQSPLGGFRVVLDLPAAT